jgi:hypothetical protein
MLRRFLFVAIAILSAAMTANAQQALLAPVDPLAWAVANTDWGAYGGEQLKNLRQVVNGQVIAHEASASYTDPQTRVVKRLKCFDPSNCVMCSPSAMKYARTMRDQMSGKSEAIQGNVSNLAALATYYDQQAQAAKDRERLNATANDYVMTETNIVDGQEVTTTKTVTFENPGTEGTARAQQLANQMRQYSANQAGMEGAQVYAYITAAQQTLQKPKPAIELNVGRDPLAEAKVKKKK